MVINFSTIKKIESDVSEGICIDWVMNNICNYKCSYCDPTLNNSSFPIKNYDRVIDFFLNLACKVNGDKFLILTGGEPTLWPPLINFINELGQDYFIKIVTNGSRSLRYFKKLVKCQNIYQVGISVHLEYADIDHISNVVKILGEHIEVNVDILADINNFTQIDKWFNMANTQKLKCDMVCKPIRLQDSGTQDYTVDQQEKIKIQRYNNAKKAPKLNVPLHFKINSENVKYKDAHNIIASKNHSFTGWKCNIGEQRLVIWYNGDIYGAQCDTARKNKLGNIYSSYSFFSDSVICEDDFCMCLPDIRIAKNV